MKKIISFCFIAFTCFSVSAAAQIPVKTLVEIVKTEDELRFDATLENLLKSANAKIRTRAALAAGRIGNDTAIPTLIALAEKDTNAQARTTAIFAIGEIESIKGADVILKILQDTKTADSIRARAVESAGKIAAANAKDAKAKLLGDAILDALEFEDKRGAKLQNRDVILFGITAALRARPEETDFVVAKFLTNFNARIRADAGNTLARIRAKNANETFRNMLLSEDDPVARANAARALGAAEDNGAFSYLLEAATEDEDSRVRVAAIRSLGSLRNKDAAERLLQRGERLLADFKKSNLANPNEKSELLEIATVLGRLLPNSNDQEAVKLLTELRKADFYHSPETEIALARITPQNYFTEYVTKVMNTIPEMSEATAKRLDWHIGSTTAQALSEILASEDVKLNEKEKEEIETYLVLTLQVGFKAMEQMVKEKNIKAEWQNIPDIMRAYTKLKLPETSKTLRELLVHQNIFIRAAAAELLGDAESNQENISALNDAFPKTKTDKLNDAALATLDALEKHYKKLAKTDAATISMIKTFEAALGSPDYLVRRKAAVIMKNAEITKDAPANLQTVTFSPQKTAAPNEFRTIRADYIRAVSRRNGTIKAFFTTEKGTFTIDLTPEDAPLTIDNFIKLARANYFNGLAIHRVVPNFVMQDGDPRGDGNGGPGWSIRCELNMLPFERGAVGMALSGKDTGGSQWFVTHSPQPHLDGGYTVFGRVNESDMKIVDQLVRGDKILSVKIIEGKLPIKSSKK